MLKRVDLLAKHKSQAAFTGNTTLDVYTDASGVPGTWLGKGFGSAGATTTTSWASFEHDTYDTLTKDGAVGIDLAPDTKYWVVANGTSSNLANLANFLIGGTSSDAEDSGGQSGWSIGNHRLWSDDGTSWSTTNTNANALHLWLVGDVKDPEPLLQSWAGPVSGRMGTDGKTLTLYFGEALDAGSVPAAGSFTVNVGVSGTGNNRTPESVAVAGSTVTLTLADAHAASARAAVAVSYDPPATSPLRTRAGVEVDSLSGLPVANDRNATAPTVSRARIVSIPSIDADSDNSPDTYGEGETIQVALTFSQKVTVDPPSARPRLKIKLHASAAASERWAVYESGSGTTALVFAYEVASGDSSSDGNTDNGIAVVANSLELNGGLIRLPWSGLAASLGHSGVGHTLGYHVDGSSDGTAPAFESATVDGTALTVTFDEDLDSGSLPARSSFCVNATPPGDFARSFCGSSGSTTLAAGSSNLLEVVLSEAVLPGETVTVAYTKPASNPLQDAGSNEVASFSGKPVTNTTMAPSAPPTGVSATAVSTKGGSLTVNWTAPSGTVTGYELRYYKGTADPPAGRDSDWVEDATGLPSPDGTATSGTITGLKASTAYRVQVRAANGPGKGPWSASASATTAAAASGNTPPRVLVYNGATSGNVCSVVNIPNPVKSEFYRDAPAATLISYSQLLGERTNSEDDWPSSCNTGSQADRWAPIFDDVDDDDLTLSVEDVSVPDNVRVSSELGFLVQQKGEAFAGTPPSPNGRVWFLGGAPLRESGARAVRAKLTATDPHGASVSVRLIFTLYPPADDNGAPQLDPVADLNVSVGRPVSLVLPAASGGDLGSSTLRLPYYYAVSGLPAGLTFDPETRTVSGMPGEIGAFTVTYTADDVDVVASAYLDPDCPNGGTYPADYLVASLRGTNCGNDTATQTFSINVRPFIELVRVVSAPTHDANGDGVNDTYVRNDAIMVDVEFTEPVEVGVATKTSNTNLLPYDYYDDVRLRLHLGENGQDTSSDGTKGARLIDVFHGGKTLRFAYKVVRPDHDPDGVRVGATAADAVVILRNSATIKGLVSGLDADVKKRSVETLNAVGADGSPLTYVSGRAGAVAGPKPVSATVDGATLTVTFDDGLAALDDADVAALPLHMGVQGAGGTGGNRNAFQHPTGYALTGDNDETLTMTLGVPARAGDRVTLTYKRIDHKGPLMDGDGNLAPAFVDFVVKNDTAGETVVTQSGVNLVGNTQQASTDGEAGTFERSYATSFTTGSASGGYVLKRVDLLAKHKSQAAFTGNTTLDVYTDASGVPGTWLGKGFGSAGATTTTSWASFEHDTYDTLTKDGAVGIDLAPDTKYWVVANGTSSNLANLANFLIGGTSSDAEDSGGQSGWSIGNHRLWSDDGTSWSTTNTNANALHLWLAGDVLDVPPAGPQPLEASVAGTALKIVFDGALDETSSVSGQHFLVEATDLNDDALAIKGTAADVAVSGSTVTVTLAETVPPGVLASVTYDPPALDLKADGSDARAPRFARFKIETVFDTVAPALTQVGVVQTSQNPAGFRAALYFDEALDPDSVPAAGDFSVTLDSRDAVTPTAVKLEGSAVVLTVDLAAAPDDEEVDGTYAEADVSYTKGTNPIQDLAGNEAAGFTQTDVPVEAAGAPAPIVAGESATLVGNTGQAEAPDAQRAGLNVDFAQSFSTGSNAQGYRLTRVDLPLKLSASGDPQPGAYSVSVHRDSAGKPGASLGTLTKPAGSLGSSWQTLQFTASGAGIDLDASATYWFVIDPVASEAAVEIGTTQSDAEDAGAAADWSIGDTVLNRITTSTDWSSTQSNANALRVAIHGYAKFSVAIPESATLVSYKAVGADAGVSRAETDSGAEDAGAADGWSLANSSLVRPVSDWVTGSRVWQIAIQGHAKVGVLQPGESAKLVGNTGQGEPSGAVSSLSIDIAQSFSTGSNAQGYRLTRVDLPMKLKAAVDPQPVAFSVSVHRDSAGKPGASLGTLTKSPAWLAASWQTRQFTASGAGIDLDASTTYWFVIDVSASEAQTDYGTTVSDAEDAGAAGDWSIGDTRLARNLSANDWSSVTSDAKSVRIDIHGHAIELGVPAGPQVSGSRLTIPFDSALDPASVPAPGSFTLHHPPVEGQTDAPEEYGSVTAVAVEGKTVVLQLDDVVYPCTKATPFTLTYEKSATGKNLRTMTGHLADDIDAAPVTNRWWWERCEENWLNGAFVGSVILRAKRPFATTEAPKPAWFAVTASGGPVTVTGAAFDPDDAHELKLEVSRAFGADETVTVSYTRPQGASGLWDVDGRQLADLSDVSVTPAPPGAAVAVVSDAGSDDTYAAGETIRVRVTFAEAVTVDTAGGTPRLAIDMDPADWGRKWAAYESGSGTAELVFAYRVAEPNESTQGIAVLADTLQANGGSIALSAGGAATLRHQGLDHDPAHKVDWRLAPAGTASVTGVALVSDAGGDDTYALGEAAR